MGATLGREACFCIWGMSSSPPLRAGWPSAARSGWGRHRTLAMTGVLWVRCFPPSVPGEAPGPPSPRGDLSRFVCDTSRARPMSLLAPSPEGKVAEEHSDEDGWGETSILENQVNGGFLASPTPSPPIGGATPPSGRGRRSDRPRTAVTPHRVAPIAKCDPSRGRKTCGLPDSQTVAPKLRQVTSGR